MALADAYAGFLKRMPGVAGPLMHLPFKKRLLWTGLMLLLYFVMGQITVYGVSQTGFEQLRFLEVLLGSSFGSIMSLGIGPIVTASIIIQLLVGSKVIPWDLTTENGKILFQGTQKLLGFVFSFVEAFVFVSFGAVPAASPALVPIVAMQLAAGGIIVIFMDELISKWGFGSGISLFIVAGVSKTIMVRTFNPLTQAGTLPGIGNPPAGALPFAITALSGGEPFQAFLALFPVVATVLVFVLAVYASAIKVEIPLAFGNLRGFGRRWPLKFFYTSNIPVILVGALIANLQLFARMLANRGISFFGEFNAQGQVTGGLAYFLSPPTDQAIAGAAVLMGVFALLGAFVAHKTRRNGLKLTIGFAVLGAVAWFAIVSALGLTSLATVPALDLVRIVTYSAVLIGGSVVFSYFWMLTSGMDAKAVAGQIEGVGMQIPGFRRDVRIIESVLDRYIPALTILGGAAIGFLAAFADFTSAIGTGTGILLAAMIVYQLYEELSSRYMEEMHPALRKLMGG